MSEFQPAGPAEGHCGALGADPGREDVVLNWGATGTQLCHGGLADQAVQRPTLLVQNKTLAAQRPTSCGESSRRTTPAGSTSSPDHDAPPARGLRPADGHLHREGLLHQRGGGAAAHSATKTRCSPAGTPRRSPPCPASTAWARRGDVKQMVTLAVGQEMDRTPCCASS
ncbi:hypothetical protein QJS66_02670 [Kocuria rhizophila]|nr:hypothetical protein QJS66_02670 [Kocuria rhizophila]